MLYKKVSYRVHTIESCETTRYEITTLYIDHMSNLALVAFVNTSMEVVEYDLT